MISYQNMCCLVFQAGILLDFVGDSVLDLLVASPLVVLATVYDDARNSYEISY